MPDLPIFLKKIYLFSKILCIFLLFIAIFGCFLIPVLNSFTLTAKASQETQSIISQVTTPDSQVDLESFSLPLTNNTESFSQELDFPVYIPAIRAQAPIISTPKTTPPIEIIDKPIPNTPPATPIPPTPLKNLSLTIAKIGLKSINLVYGTNRNIPEIDKLLLNNPVIESQDAVNICSESGNSYIFGHSEPPDSSNPGGAGRIFGNLDSLNPGDIIELVSAEGLPCKYKVDKWDQMVVGSDSTVDMNEYYRVMQYPEKPTPSSLTIQTCKKGSSTVRLLLRASRI